MNAHFYAKLIASGFTLNGFTDFIHTSQKNINKLHALGGVEFDNELTVTVQGLIDKGLCLAP